MKKLCFALFLGLVPALFFSQNIPFKIQKSQKFQDEFRQSTVVLAEDDGKDGVLMVRSYKAGGISNGEGFYIERYDSDLTMKSTFDFEMKHPNHQKFNLVVGVFSFENVVQIVEMYYDLNDKSYICQANSITEDFRISKKELFRLTKEDSKKLGSFSLQQKFYARIDEIWTNTNSGDIQSEIDYSESSSFSDSFNFSWKRKSTKNVTGSDLTLVVNEAKNAFAIALDLNTKNSEALKLYLFDNRLDKKIDTVFTREIKDKRYVFQNIQVSKDGAALYLLGKAYTPELKKKEEGGKYFFELTKITAESLQSQAIDPGNHFIGSLKMVFHESDLYCLGFYSDIKDNRFKGISFFKLNPNSLEIVNSKYNPFTDQFMVDKYGENKDKALKFLTFRKIAFTKNNDLIFNAEEEYMISSGSAGGPGGMHGTGNRTYFHYDDIICAKLNSQGDLLWARNINKSQTNDVNDDSYISYASMLKEESSYFFINTGEKVNKLKNDRIEFDQVRKNKSNLNIIRINPNGDFDFEEILDDESSEVPFMVSKGTSINDAIYFLGRKGKDKQLLKVTL